MKRIKSHLPIYGGQLLIIVAKNFTKAKKKYKVKLPRSFDVEDTVAFVCSGWHKDKFSYVIFVKPNASKSTIAHECVHLTNEVYLHIHSPLKRNNDEHQAYITGYFVEQVHKALKK